MGVFSRYVLRLARKRWRIRAFRKRRELRSLVDQTQLITPDNILLFSTLRNERVRLPYFLRYYRETARIRFALLRLTILHGPEPVITEFARATTPARITKA